MKIQNLIHNQPFMMKPTAKAEQIDESNEQGSLRENQKKMRRVDELKDKIRILIETPLFVNAEFIKQGLFEPDSNARIL